MSAESNGNRGKVPDEYRQATQDTLNLMREIKESGDNSRAAELSASFKRQRDIAWDSFKQLRDIRHASAYTEGQKDGFTQKPSSDVLDSFAFKEHETVRELYYKGLEDGAARAREQERGPSGPVGSGGHFVDPIEPLGSQYNPLYTTEKKWHIGED